MQYPIKYTKFPNCRTSLDCYARRICMEGLFLAKKILRKCYQNVTHTQS